MITIPYYFPDKVSAIFIDETGSTPTLHRELSAGNETSCLFARGVIYMPYVEKRRTIKED